MNIMEENQKREEKKKECNFRKNFLRATNNGYMPNNKDELMKYKDWFKYIRILAKN